MKQLKSFDFTDAQRKKLASIILKLDKEKQDILISGDNIATINGQSLLNGGNISIIKTGIFTIVTELPTNDIDKDKVYLVPSKETNDENKFSEYIYTDNGWEKLGTITTEVNLSNYVQHTDVVTDTTDGLMLASDKAKLDAFKEAEQYTKAPNLPDSVISNADISSDANNVTLKYTKDGLIDGGNSEVNLQIPAATTTIAGVLSAEDKTTIGRIPSNVVSNIRQRTPENKHNVTLEWDYKDMKDGLNKGHDIVIFHATEDYAGVMSAPDKVKLDGIEAGAQVNTIESVSVNGTPLEITNKGVDIPNATASKQGLMSKEDKTKLDSLENYTLPAATTTTLGGVKISTIVDNNKNQIHITNNGTIQILLNLRYNSTYKNIVLEDLITSKAINSIDCTKLIKEGPIASITENGLMSAVDKAKLDNQPTIKASDATGVTDDDYVVIKKSELDSILSRLSALESKA